MKTRIHFFIALLALPFVLVAQNEDDDMYFVPNKKAEKTEKAQKKEKYERKPYTATEHNVVTHSDLQTSAEPDAEYYSGQLRDVDEYNRRYRESSTLKARVINDTLYIDTETEQEANAFANDDRHGYYSDDCYYDDDFYYSSRLIRYHGRHFYDPFMWDYCYGWYDPWYDPWYGFYGPYYRYGYYSWYNWGWGRHHRPGWIWGWGWGSPIYHPHYPPHHGHKPGYGQSGGHRFGTGRHDFVNRGNSNGIHNGNRVLPARTQGVPNASSRGLRGTLTRDSQRSTLRQNVGTRERTNTTIVNGRSTNRNTTANRSTVPTTNRNSTNVTPSRSTSTRSSSSSFGSSRSSSGSSFGGGGSFSGGSRGGGGGGGRGGR